MALLDKLEELQKKPESYRWKVLVISLSVLMLIVFFIWITTIDLSLERPGSETGALEDLKEPLGVIKESAAEVYKIFGDR